MKDVFIVRALENLKCAEMAFENELFNASANRAYYAAFQVAIAAIYSIGIEPKIEHKTIQILFADNFFNRKKVISSKYKGYFGELQKKRNKADYQMGISKKEAAEQLKCAKEIIEIILEIIK